MIRVLKASDLDRWWVAQARRPGGRLPLQSLVTLVMSLLLTGFSSRLSAQQAHEIAGRVTDLAQMAIVGATVVIASEDGQWRASVLTGDDGAFRRELPASVTLIVITVRRLGYYQQSRVIKVTSGARVQNAVVMMRALPKSLAPINVQSERTRVSTAPYDPSKQGSGNSALGATLLPIDIEQFGDWAQWQPGVNAANGGLSINGQPASQTGIQVDGAGFTGAGIPREAIQSIAVTTSAFDPRIGRYSGGLISTTTRSGGDHWTAIVGGGLSGGKLQYPSGAGTLGPSPSTRTQLSLGAGGPIIPQRVYGYFATDAHDNVTTRTPLEQSLSDRDGALGFSGETMSRLNETLSTIGVPLDFGVNPSQVSRSVNTYGRLDVVVSPRVVAMLRLTAGDNNGDRLGMSPTSLASTSYTQTTKERSVLARMEYANGPWTVTASASQSHSESLRSPRWFGPSALVWVDAGTIGDAASASVNIGGGPPRFASLHSLTEFSVETSRRTQDGRHEWRLGLASFGDHAQVDPGSTFGSFVFNSIVDLGASRPSAFVRAPQTPAMHFATTDGAAFLRDSWRPAKLWSVVYGTRVEWGHLDLTSGDSVAHQESHALGLRVNPRIGFQYNSSDNRWTVRGGAGEFRGAVPVSELASDAMGATRDPGEHCVGADITPTQWPLLLHRTAVATLPQCNVSTASDQTNFLVSQYANPFRAPEVRQFDAQGSWSAAGGNRFLSMDISHTMGRYSALAFEHALTTPQFVLRSEADRPVFVSPSAIDGSTGLVRALAPAETPRYQEIATVGTNDVTRLALSGTLVLQPHGRQILLSTTVERTWSRMATTGFDAPEAVSAGTAGNPNAIEYLNNVASPPYALSGVVHTSLTRDVDLALMFRTSVGLTFTPLVDADINGDGRANDRAWVPDARTEPDTNLRTGISHLLQNAPVFVRQCLVGQQGTIAAGASCRLPVSTRVDAQVNWRLRAFAAFKRVDVSLRLQNLGAGLDALLHGAANMRGWGQTQFPDQTLLRVRGFDPVRRAFLYDVNADFGVPRVSRWAFTPFTMQLRVRIPIGSSDPAREQWSNLLEATKTDTRAPEKLRALLGMRFPSVPTRVLDLADSLALHLTVQQMVALQASADSLQPRLDVVLDQLMRELLRASQSPRVPRSALTDALIVEARRLGAAGVTVTRTALDDAQWRLLPVSLSSPTFDVPVPGVSFDGIP